MCRHHKLKTQAKDSGIQVSCPDCGKVVLVPNTKDHDQALNHFITKSRTEVHNVHDLDYLSEDFLK